MDRFSLRWFFKLNLKDFLIPNSQKKLRFPFPDLNFKETETEFDSGESKVASTLETRLFNLKWKIKTGNMAEFTFVVRGSSWLTFILVEANYVSLIMWLFLHCPQNTPLCSSLILKCSFTPTKWPPCLFWVHFKQRMQNIMTVCFGLLFQLI